MWAMIIMFCLLAAATGGLCGIVGGLSHRGERVSPGAILLLCILVIGVGILGKWLIASEVLTKGKLVGVFAVAFIPIGVLSLFGFSRHGGA